MTTEEWYFELDKRSIELFDKLETYLKQLNDGDKKHYLKCGERSVNDFKFIIGHRQLILNYMIDLKELSCLFKTSELRVNSKNYGTMEMEEIDSLTFILDDDAHLNFIQEKEQGSTFQRDTRVFPPSKRINDFPADYLAQVKKCFKTI